MRLPRFFSVAFAAAALAAAVSAPPVMAQEGASCDRFAAPSGSDSAAGTAGAPYRTAQRLADSIGPGATGCLRAGTYAEDVTVTHGGAGGAPATIRSYPGERAELDGHLWVAKGADYVTVERLWLDGRSSSAPSPSITADHVKFRFNDVTNDHTNICFSVGHGIGEPQYGRAHGTVLEGNTVHDCGALPATNHHHGIYVANADDTRITGNWIYDNADRGIQLYPDAQRTTITGNVIDGNGQGVAFGGENGDSSSGSRVRNNVITNSSLRYNVESYYPAGTPAGRDNVVSRNCVNGGDRDANDGGIQDAPGFSASSNVERDPKFRSRRAHDLRLSGGSRCKRVFANRHVPGPTGGTAPSRPRLVLSAQPRRVAPGRSTRLLGRVKGRRLAPGTRVKILRRGRHGWKVAARTRLRRNGRFSTRRHLRAGGPAVSLRAVARGAKPSRTVRLRVAR